MTIETAVQKNAYIQIYGENGRIIERECNGKYYFYRKSKRKI